MSFINWSYYKRSALHVAFRLEVHPEAWPKDKFYASAPKYFTLELGLGYWVLWIECNRNEQAMLHSKPIFDLPRMRPRDVRPVRKTVSSRRTRRSVRST